MKNAFSENAVAYPKSYVGRAVLYLLFVAPAAILAFFTLRRFLYVLARAAYNMYCYSFSLKESPRRIVYIDASDWVADKLSGFALHFCVQIAYYIYAYFDIVFSIGCFLMVCWVVARFRKNGAFDCGDWFRIFACAVALYELFLAAAVLLGHFDGGCGGSHAMFALHCFFRVVRIAVEFGLLYFSARFVFLRIPYGEDASWGGEMSAGEFFSRNFKCAFAALKSFGIRNIVFAFCAVVALEFVYWTLLSV